MSEFEQVFGECPRCGRAYATYTARCRSCDFGLLRKEFEPKDSSEPSISKEVLETLELDLFKYLNQRSFTPQQFKSLLTIVGPKLFPDELPKSSSIQSTFENHWSRNRDISKKIIESLLQAKEKAKADPKLWDSILRSEARRQYYAATKTPYDSKNLLNDVRDNLEILDLLAGESAESKIESLKALYFDDPRKFQHALTFIVKSATLIDLPKERWSEDNIAYSENGVVNSWYFYNKFGGRSGRGYGSRG